jgi:hypothetical protein
MTDTHQALARTSTRGARDEDRMFDMESLREELSHKDGNRRQAARTAMYWLSRLATLRARITGAARDQVWKQIFQAKQLQADLHSADDSLRHLAHRVLAAVSGVAAIRVVMDSTEPTLLDIKVRAIALRILGREKANEVARANGVPELAYTLH